MSEYPRVSETPENIERDIDTLETSLRRLESEYNMYFAGRLPRPPLETRSFVSTLVRRLDNVHITNYGIRFRFTTLQARFSKLSTLWDRGLRAKEEGRAGPFVPARRPEAPAPPAATEPPRPVERVVSVATFTDPMREMEKVQGLYNQLSEARREVGQEAIPFHKFAELVKAQVSALKAKGGAEVAFRVAVKDGKVALTAKSSGGGGGRSKA